MERRFQKTLSSGQCASFFFTEMKYKDTHNPYIAQIGFVIGDSFSANKRWWRSITKGGYRATGKCGLEALMWALCLIKELQKSYSGIYIFPANEHREKAYAWLERYGFELITDAGLSCYEWVAPV